MIRQKRQAIHHTMILFKFQCFLYCFLERTLFHGMMYFADHDTPHYWWQIEPPSVVNHPGSLEPRNRCTLVCETSRGLIRPPILPTKTPKSPVSQWSLSYSGGSSTWVPTQVLYLTSTSTATPLLNLLYLRNEELRHWAPTTSYPASKIEEFSVKLR